MDEQNYEIIKGQLTDAEETGLHQVLDDLTAAAEAARNTKPNTRGWWGKESVTDNPTGYRNPVLPE